MSIFAGCARCWNRMVMMLWSKRCVALGTGFRPGSSLSLYIASWNIALSKPWSSLCQRLALIFIGAALLGWMADRLTLALLLAALGELAWQLWQLYRLDRWL
ncbi:MAG TPA: hypothetical protein DEP36_08790, partial [Gammaproteobacteria bacterium]|nr:hypothetical protein [Gammaproteobacteria bacterium]